MIGFALLELHPRFEKLEFDREYLPFGGLVSGFFGGLSGHQGALRSAFLAKVGISPEGFVGTNAVIGLLVDLTRPPTSRWESVRRKQAEPLPIETRSARARGSLHNGRVRPSGGGRSCRASAERRGSGASRSSGLR